MSAFHFVALSTERAQRLRTGDAGKDGLGSSRKSLEPDDAAPCRHCLEDAIAGEEVLLASYSPFAGTGPYNERGPIFIHAHDCTRPTPSSSLPGIVARRLVAVRAYNTQEEIIAADLVEGRDAGGLITRLLANDAAAFLHVRAARYGCYLCRVERALSP